MIDWSGRRKIKGKYFWSNFPVWNVKHDKRIRNPSNLVPIMNQIESFNGRKEEMPCEAILTAPKCTEKVADNSRVVCKRENTQAESVKISL